MKLMNVFAEKNPKLAQFWKARGTESVFGAMAILCFAIYLLNLNQIQSIGLDRQPLAEMEEGIVNRKQSGTSTFDSVHVGDRFFNHDIISVPDGGYGVLRFLDDGSEMVIRGGSFLTLTRSLKYLHTTQILVTVGEVDIHKKYWNFRLSDYDIQTGRIKAQNKLVPKPVPSEASPEPSAEPSEEPKKPSGPPRPMASLSQSYDIHPKQSSILVKVMGNQADVLFSWPSAMSGEVVVKNEAGAIAGKAGLKSTTQATIKLPLNQKYTWVIHGTDKDLGPFGFTLYSMKGHPLSGFMDHNQSNAVVEVLQ